MTKKKVVSVPAQTASAENEIVLNGVIYVRADKAPAATNAFRGVRIVDKNYTDPLWGLNNFPVVKYTVEQAEREEK